MYAEKEHDIDLSEDHYYGDGLAELGAIIEEENLEKELDLIEDIDLGEDDYYGDSYADLY